MRPKHIQKVIRIVTPAPYFNLSFGCTNRHFYKIKSQIYKIGIDIGIDPQDGYIDETCDYEGDLEKLTIYGSERSEEFIQAILSHYEVGKYDTQGLDIVLSIF